MKKEGENIDRELVPQIIYQKAIDGTIEAREAFRLLVYLEFNNPNQEIKAEAAKYRTSLVKLNTAWQVAQYNNNIELYLDDGVHPSEAPVLALLEILTESEILGYEINDEGRIILLPIFGSDDSYIGIFPEQICDLKFLQILYFRNQNAKSIPECIKKLSYLEKLDLSYNDLENFPNAIHELKNLTNLDLSYNKIRELPHFVKELTHLKQLYLADEELNVPHRNVFDCVDIANLKEDLSLRAISELFKELEKKEQTEREALTMKFSEQKEPGTIIYPSKEILSVPPKTPRKFEYIILWMLYNNDICSWSDFKSDPINLSPATLSKYLSLLLDMRNIYKVSKGYFVISESGKKRLREIERGVLK